MRGGYLGDEDAARDLGDVLERSLHTIEDGVHDAGTEVDGKGLVGAVDDVADSKTGSLLVHLDGGSLALETDDLTHKTLSTHTDKLVHGSSAHTVSDDHRAGDGVDYSIFALLFHCVVCLKIVFSFSWLWLLLILKKEKSFLYIFLYIIVCLLCFFALRSLFRDFY